MLVAAPKLPEPVPSSTEMLLEKRLDTTRSRLPSPFMSFTAIDVGPSPAAKLVAAPKLPEPLPSSTETLSEP